MAITANDYSWYEKSKDRGGPRDTTPVGTIYIASLMSDDTTVGKILSDLFEDKVEQVKFDKEGLGGFIHSKELGIRFTFYRPTDYIVVDSLNSIQIISQDAFRSHFSPITVK